MTSIKPLLLVGILFILTGSLHAQPRKAILPTKASAGTSGPKLVVGIVVDQMRYDYLYRYYDKYGASGFKRLMNEGFNCRNNHYHYAATYTGPGHAAVYTGSAPALNGIVGNDF
ncbi:MAG: alkaline phosphatase family protein, partial [Bacteroidetes bacterium]|nr:alkaline phosphatase family protein [Fibrella sp.]